MRLPGCSIQSGFSLVEAVLTIVLLGIALSLAAPLVSSTLEKSRQNRCLEHLKTLGTTLDLYLADHEQVYPEMVSERKSRLENVAVLDTVLSDYVSLQEVFTCPADRERRLWKKSGTSYGWNQALNNKRRVDLAAFEEPRRIPVFFDKGDFHLVVPTRRNTLFLDGSADTESGYHLSAKPEKP